MHVLHVRDSSLKVLGNKCKYNKYISVLGPYVEVITPAVGIFRRNHKK